VLQKGESARLRWLWKLPRVQSLCWTFEEGKVHRRNEEDEGQGRSGRMPGELRSVQAMELFLVEQRFPLGVKTGEVDYWALA
jgi:hypothetical protein